MPKTFTATTQDMAILVNEQLSQNQGTTAEGYLICQNVPVSRIGVQYYLGSELGLAREANKRIPVYRLAEDVFEPESLQSLESKPVTDDHPQQAVTVENAGFLARGHGRNARHNEKQVIADLVLTDPTLIQGVREKRKYEISLGYTCQYEPYKDGYRQKNIRINHIAVVESGRAGRKVAIQDKAPVPVKNRRTRLMNKNQAMAAMFAAFAKDASPDEIQSVLPFMTDAAPEPAKPAADADKSDKGLVALLTGLLVKDAKPAKEETEKPLTADALSKLVSDEVAKALKAATKDKSAKDEDEEEIEKMLADEDGDDDETKDADPDKETEDEDEEEAKEAKDAAFAATVKALKPVYDTLPKKEQKKVLDGLKKLRGTSDAANGYQEILKIVKKHAVKDSAAAGTTAKPVNPEALSKRVMERFNPHAPKKQA